MDEQQNEAPRRGRPPRQQEVQQQRRRRVSLGASRNLKLHVPEQWKDPDYEYRWINHEAGRVRQLTELDDWDVVDQGRLSGDPDPEKNASVGAMLERVTDRQNGTRQVLVRKPKKLYEADKAEEQAKIAAQEDHMRRAPLPSPEGLSGPHAYVPNGRNIVGGK